MTRPAPTINAELEALLKRAFTCLLVNAGDQPPSAGERGFAFWQGYIKALKDFSNGAGSTLAALDQARSGYQPPSHLAGAFAAMAMNGEWCTRAQAQQILSAHSVEPFSPTQPAQLEVVEIDGQAAEDLLVSSFGALSLEPTNEAQFFGKLQRAFGRSNGSAA